MNELKVLNYVTKRPPELIEVANNTLILEAYVELTKYVELRMEAEKQGKTLGLVIQIVDRDLEREKLILGEKI